MNLEQIGILAEILSAAAVAVTVLFLVFEVRQNTRALRAQSMNAANEAFNTINLQVASSTEQAQIYLVCSQDYENAPQEMKVQFNFTCMSLFRIFESIYLQVHMGVGDPRLWEAEERSVQALVSMPGIQQWWRDNTFSFSNEFRGMMDRYIAQAAK